MFSTLAGKLRWRGRSWVFDLNKSVLCPSFIEGLTAKGLGPSRGRFPYCFLYIFTVPFVTSSVTPTPERKGGGHGDYVTGPNLRTQLASKRFVVLTDSSHHSSTHSADDEVTSIVMSSMSPPHVLTAVVATTIIANVTSAPVPRDDTYTELSTDSFFMSQDVDSDTLYQIYIPKWNVTNDSALDDPDICRVVIDHLAPPALFSQLHSMNYKQLFTEFNVGTTRQLCLGSEVRLRLEHKLRGRLKFEDKCAMQAGWLKDKDAEIASLKAQLSLK
ncbi:hypothetical protein Tco_0390977 [Tanacetum coccineum]